MTKIGRNYYLRKCVLLFTYNEYKKKFEKYLNNSVWQQFYEVVVDLFVWHPNPLGKNTLNIFLSKKKKTFMKRIRNGIQPFLLKKFFVQKLLDFFSHFPEKNARQSSIIIDGLHLLVTFALRIFTQPRTLVTFYFLFS